MDDRSPTIELVVTDLDGTLWERPDSVPDRTRDALRYVDSGPVRLLVATGRRVVSTREPLGSLGVAPPAVVLNGALGLDLGSGERFHVGGFGRDDAARVLSAFAAHDLDPCIYIDHDAPSVWVGASPSTHPAHLASLGSDVGNGDLAHVVENEAVLAFAVLGLPEGVAAATAQSLGRIATTHLAPDRQYGDFSLTVAPLERSKWDAIASFCDAQGLDPGAVLVLGDGPNDVEMLGHAAVAVVPEDGHPAALALADHVIGRAADGGWAEVLAFL